MPAGGRLRGSGGVTAQCIVSRTRCSVLYDAPQSRDPNLHLCNHGPRISSAPRRYCGALRSIRGTGTVTVRSGGIATAQIHRVPDAVQRPSRCTAEPGPTLALCNHGPRISSAPRRSCGALRSIRGTGTVTARSGGTDASCPGRGAASFTMHRRAGPHTFIVQPWAPDQQRTTPLLRRAAQHPGREKASGRCLRNSIGQSNRANPG